MESIDHLRVLLSTSEGALLFTIAWGVCFSLLGFFILYMIRDRFVYRPPGTAPASEVPRDRRHGPILWLCTAAFLGTLGYVWIVSR